MMPVRMGVRSVLISPEYRFATINPVRIAQEWDGCSLARSPRTPTRVGGRRGVSGVGKSTPPAGSRCPDPPYTEIDGLYHGPVGCRGRNSSPMLELFTREPA
jgi:hypothetical protein